MLYIFNHFLWFFLPGLLTLYLFRFSRATFLVSLAISYSLMMLILLPLIYFGLDPVWFTRLMYLQLGILLLASAIKLLLKNRRLLSSVSISTLLRLTFSSFPFSFQRFRQRLTSLRLAPFSISKLLRLTFSSLYPLSGGDRRLHCHPSPASSLPLVFLFAAFGIYWLYAGPYLEVPTDVWEHLVRIRYMSDLAEAGKFDESPGLIALVTEQGWHWYFIVNWLCVQSGVTIASALNSIILVNTLAFLAGVFFFALFVFRKIRCSKNVKMWIAAGSVLFFFLHSGVIVFSYVRYYPMGPAMLNYLVFFAALVVWVKFLEGGRGSLAGFLVSPFFVLTMLTVHTQEAVFAAVMIPLVSMATGISVWSSRRNWRGDAVFWRSIITFCLACLGWLVLFVLVRMTRAPSEKFLNYLVVVGENFPVFKNGMVIRPKFALEVITVWGLFVYVLFVARIRMFLKSPVIIAGMIAPVLTLFNPVFVDMVLRTAGQGGSAVYRFAYLAPLGFVAGWVSVDAARKLLKGLKCSGAQRVWIVGRSVVVLSALIVLLFPVHPGMARQSRMLTLRRTPEENSYEMWADLFSFLRTLPRKYVITDPVTGYLANGLTRHYFNTTKFWRAWWNLRVNSPDTPLKKAFRRLDMSKDWLLVVNRRDGGMSEVGEVSIHWPPDVLKMGQYYPEVMLDYVENRPEVFVKIWEQDRISVYEIKWTEGE